MLSLISTISQSLRPCPWQPKARVSLMLGRASFSCTYPASITGAEREQESEEARAARLARDRQYMKAYLEKETDEARAARLARLRQYKKARLENETEQDREARLARNRQYTGARRERETDEQRQNRLASGRRYMRDVHETETPEQRHERLAHLRRRYAASPELRETLAEYRRRSKRKPDIREKLKEYQKLARQKERLLCNNSHRQVHHVNLMDRRASSLNIVICRRQGIQEWAWKSHTPVLEHDRVDHKCTACGNIRFLRLWWKEKLPRQAKDANSDRDQYMCNHCFANNFKLMVPETYTGKLPRLFTSPDHPPPYRCERLKAEASAHEVKKEHEEDPKSMHEKDDQEGRT
jgi:hypothetical protein